MVVLQVKEIITGKLKMKETFWNYSWPFMWHQPPAATVREGYGELHWLHIDSRPNCASAIIFSSRCNMSGAKDTLWGQIWRVSERVNNCALFTFSPEPFSIRVSVTTKIWCWEAAKRSSKSMPFLELYRETTLYLQLRRPGGRYYRTNGRTWLRS